MRDKKRVLVCEFHQETNTFNPIVMPLEAFKALRYAEGIEGYNLCKSLPCTVHGIIDAIEEADGIVIPTIFLYTVAGGRVSDDVTKLLYDRMQHYIEEAGEFDAVCAALHGATCAESEDDVCGAFLTYLRELVGEDIPIAVSFDLHANITETILKKADIICGYQSYPHVDIYETGYRAATLCMRKLRKNPTFMAVTSVPMLVPPVGYTSLEQPFKGVIDSGKALLTDKTLLDFTVFNVQPWLDVPEISSTVVTIAENAETAKRQAESLARKLFDNRDGYWPDLMSIDQAIDRAEANTSGKPVILVDSADSPNSGAVGDSVTVAIRLLERGSNLRTGMFVKDPEAVNYAFSVGVGHSAEFELGAKFTPNIPGPLKAVGTVRSLHDGHVLQEGPVGKGSPFYVGKAAVISFGNLKIMVCEAPAVPGDPQLFRHFGIEPLLHDLIVVKANCSFRVPYSKFAGEFCFTETPGAGTSNLKSFLWKNIPKGLYPFDLPVDYQIKKAKLGRYSSEIRTQRFERKK